MKKSLVNPLKIIRQEDKYRRIEGYSYLFIKYKVVGFILNYI